MIIYPAVIVHGLADARAALAPGRPVALLSASGAGLFAGCLWWRELVAAALAEHQGAEHQGAEHQGAEHQGVDVTDVLDCADGSGVALGALRSGVCRLVLWPAAPGWDGVAAIARRQGGFVLRRAPVALDMAQPGAARRLHKWLLNHGPNPGDSDPCLG